MKAKHIVTMVIAGTLVTSMAQADIEGYERKQDGKRERKQDGKRERKQDGKRERKQDGKRERKQDGKAEKNQNRNHNRKGHRQPMGMMLGKIATNPEMAKKLGLSEEQVNTLKEAIAEHQEQQKALQEKMKAAAKEQLEQMQADEVNEEALMHAVEKTGEVRTEIAKLRIKQMLAAKKILSPEQAAEIKELMKERFKKAKKGRGDKAGKDDKRKNRDKKKNGKRNRARNQEEKG